MNKSKLQQELQEKVKPGVKPSDLKKKNSPTNSANSDYGLLTPPPTPPLKPSKEDILPPSIAEYSTPPDSPLLKPTKPSKPSENVEELKKQVIYWSQTAQNHLLNLSKTSAELFNAEERIKELERQATMCPKSPLKNPTKTPIKDQPETVNEAAERALMEANQIIRQQEQTIRELQAKNHTLNKTIEKQNHTATNQAKPLVENNQPTFLCSDCQQTKSTSELSRQFNNFSFCRSCSVKARKSAEREKQPEPTQFTCHSCETTKEETPNKMKLDQTLQEYLVCSECRPTLKEFNEADLITDELWEKYPYSSASEILAKEFGIRKEETW